MKTIEDIINSLEDNLKPVNQNLNEIKSAVHKQINKDLAQTINPMPKPPIEILLGEILLELKKITSLLDKK